MPRKMRRLAVRSALSAKYAADEIMFVEGWSFERPRTKDMIDALSALNVAGKTLIVIDQKDAILQKSASNVTGVRTLLANYLNVIDLLTADRVVISRAAVDVIDGWLGSPNGADDGAEEA
jgi:large subunit ribosomal protein L4